MKTHGHSDWAMFYSKQKQSLPEGDTKYPTLIYLIYTLFSMIFPLKMVIVHRFFVCQALATELRQAPRAKDATATRGASFVSLYPWMGIACVRVQMSWESSEVQQKWDKNVGDSWIPGRCVGMGLMMD